MRDQTAGQMPEHELQTLDEFYARWQPAIRDLHDNPIRFGIVATGGGVVAGTALQLVPGASKTLISVETPYATEAFDRWLGRSPEKYCSPETSLAMAARARQLTAVENLDAEHHAVLAITASLATTRPKRGPHQAHVALLGRRRSLQWSVKLQKGYRSRMEEELLVSDLVLRAMMDFSGVNVDFADGLTDADSVDRRDILTPAALVDLQEGRSDVVWAEPGAESHVVLRNEPPQVFHGVLCGSFNPLHAGHVDLAEVAERQLGGAVAFELTVTNADKPAIDPMTVLDRCGQPFTRPLCLTSADTFLAKSRLFPGTAFVVGFDTAERILQPRFYSATDGGLEGAIAELRANRTRFLVAGRLHEGRFQGIDELRIPEDAQGMFLGIPENEFRSDLSSTALRNGQVENAG